MDYAWVLQGAGFGIMEKHMECRMDNEGGNYFLIKCEITWNMT